MARRLQVEVALSIRARDLLPSDIISVSAREMVADVALRMQSHNISQFPVLDAETGTFTGVVSEATLARLLALHGDPERAGRLRVGEVMDGPPAVVDGGAPLEEVASLLSENPLVLTLRDGRVSGLLTRADLLRAFSSSWAASREPPRRRFIRRLLRRLR